MFPLFVLFFLPFVFSALPAHAADHAGAGLDVPHLELEDPRVSDLLPPDLPATLESDPDAVVGGSPAPSGTWDDAVAIVFYGSYVGCTGTLVAPDVVITAAHCADGITHVIVGTTDWTTNEGEMIAVSAIEVHPAYWSGGADIAALGLQTSSSYPHRLIATDCIRDQYLQDGASVQIVGFGMTDEAGTVSTTRLHEATTTIDSHDCSEDYADGVYMGCAGSIINPGGEIGAGGNGVDACFGDSGGPLYLTTPEGDFVTGVTSRAYAGASWSYPCRDGGIWTRPDPFIDWIEDVTNRTLDRPVCNEAPVVSADRIVVPPGGSGTTWLEISDHGSQFTAVVSSPPSHGTASVANDGEITYIADPGSSGPDPFTVAVTDAGSAYDGSGPITVDVDIDVQVQGGADGTGGAFPDGGDPDTARGELPAEPAYITMGGCNTASSTPAGLGTAWVLIAVALRRRRRRTRVRPG